MKRLDKAYVSAWVMLLVFVPMVCSLCWSERMAHAYKNSYDGYVPGSQFHQRALSGIVGVFRE